MYATKQRIKYYFKEDNHIFNFLSNLVQTCYVSYKIFEEKNP